MARCMSKKSRFRKPFNKQHDKRTQTLLKSSPLQLFQIYWSLSKHLSRKNSLLLTCQTLEPLVNTLAADDKYPVLNRDNLRTSIQILLSQKQTTFPENFAAFLKSTKILNILRKKMILRDFVFLKLRTPKTWLGKCLKSPVSEDPSTSNMVKMPKHCWNLPHSTFIIFVHHCEGNWVVKSVY